jgi:hypothetical protein
VTSIREWGPAALRVRDLFSPFGLRPEIYAFDNPLAPQPAAVFPTFESVRNCRIEEEPGRVLVNRETKQLFTYKDACVVHGVHLGHDLTATEASTKAVKAFLRAAFKLN